MKIVGKIFSFIRWILPWVINAIFFAVECMVRCLVGQFKGMADEAKKEAETRTHEVMSFSKIPLEYEKYVKGVMMVIAWGFILFGYILVCHVVVWLVWRFI